MRKLGVALVMLAVLGVSMATWAATARPLSGPALLAIDERAGFRNFLPTRLLAGFAYVGWSARGATLRVDFRNRSGWLLEWRVQPITGSCGAGSATSYQLDGNKVWWAEDAKEQRACRCTFDLAGKPVRLVAASAVPGTELAPSGLGLVVASAKRA